VEENKCILGFGGESLRKETFGRPSLRWGNFKACIKEMEWDDMEWINLAHDI